MEIRRRLHDLLDEHPLWNGTTRALQVTGAGPHGLHLRASVSARDAPTLYDLRCEIREQLLTWLAHEYPEALPRTRFNGLGDSDIAPRLPVRI